MADVTRPAVQLANLLDKAGAEKAAGDARFNISICGKLVESDFLPADGDRYRTAFRRRYIVRNDGDCIMIGLKAVKGKPFLAGIKVRLLGK